MSRRVPRGTFRRSCRRCGWTATYSTAGRADYSKSRHSCARQAALADRQQRGEVRRATWAAIDRTPKPCQHKVANHQHGTYAAYTLDACRCEACAQAVSDYERDRTRRNAYGRSNLTDASPVRDHVRQLGSQGMGWKRVATAAGVSNGAMWKLLYGRRNADGSLKMSARVKHDLAERLLAVELDLADHAILPAQRAIGVRRRLQALVALGWSQSKLGQRLGINPQNMTRVVHGDDGIQVRTARAVTALYAELSMTLPPQDNHRDRISVARSLRMARERGWLPPLALDDERLDDPDYKPRPPSWQERSAARSGIDDAAIQRRMEGERIKLNADEAAELVRRWVASGRSLNECKRITGLAPHRYAPTEEAS